MQSDVVCIRAANFSVGVAGTVFLSKKLKAVLFRCSSFYLTYEYVCDFTFSQNSGVSFFYALPINCIVLNTIFLLFFVIFASVSLLIDVNTAMIC